MFNNIPHWYSSTEIFHLLDNHIINTHLFHLIWIRQKGPFYVFAWMNFLPVNV